MRYIFLIFTVMSVLLVASCGGQLAKNEAPGQNRIIIRGSHTMTVLIQRWAEEFMKERPGLAIYVEGGGSNAGIRGLINGTADIAATSRPWQPEEIKELVDAHGSLGISILTAKDALSIYLNDANPVRALSLEQLRKIFSGEITNWIALGGPDSPIIVLNRNPNSGTYHFLSEHILLGENYTENAIVMNTNKGITNYISNDPLAIGYGGMAYGMDLRHCKIDGIEPTKENVRNGSYPISRYLRLYTVKPPEGNIKEFIDWVLSTKGQKIVREVGYIPLVE